MNHIYVFLFLFLSFTVTSQEVSYSFDMGSYLGGSDFEQSRNLAVDKDGYIYLTGGTSSPDFPTTPGVYQETYDGRGSATVGNWGPMSAFVSKFSPDGQLIWSTFVGGPSYDRAYAIEVAENGLIYIGGRAGEGYPTTQGALQENFTTAGNINRLYGHQNGFISVLSPDGTNLLYSTYYGSDSYGFFRDIDIDDMGNVYGILNAVRRTPLGIRPDAFDTSHNGGQYDMVPVKFSPQLDSVIWATFLGGSGIDQGGPSIRVGSDYSVFVAGGTESTDFPVTPGSVQTQFGGGRTDMFVTRLAPDGTELIYSTYFGGNDFDVSETHSLFVDHLNQAHVACGTKSTDIVTTPGALKASKPGSDIDALLFKLSADGTQLMASSYYGGSGNDYSEGLFTGPDGDLYFGGTMGSDDLPVTSSAFQDSYQGGEDAFIARVDSNFTELKYSSYFGGSGMDAIRAFAAGPDGSIVFGGQTQSNDLPTTSGAFQEQRMVANDRADCFVGVLVPGMTTSNDDRRRSTEKMTFPNPASGDLFFNISRPDLTCRLYSLTGRLLLKASLVHGQIDVSHLQAGMYIYEVLGKGVRYTGRVVKE